MDRETEDSPPRASQHHQSGTPDLRAQDGSVNPTGARGWERTVTQCVMSARALVSRLASRGTFTRRRVVTAGVIVAVLAFVFGLRFPSSPPPAQTAPDTRVFSVTGRPTLLFKHFIGNVNITPGPSSQVRIAESRSGETDEIDVHYAQQGDTVAVTVDMPSGLMEDTWVDFNVQVPARAGFTATVSTGTLEATGLTGPIALNNTNGAVWATNLAGPVTLRTLSGSINLTNVSGQVTIVTQNGTITTTATRLEGGSSIQADSGTINFHGSLARTGTYQFENSNGAVGITLPANSAFAVIAHTHGGSISSDFHGVTVTQSNGHTAAQGMVGGVSRARVVINTTGGSIGLHQGN